MGGGVFSSYHVVSGINLRSAGWVAAALSHGATLPAHSLIFKGRKTWTKRQMWEELLAIETKRRWERTPQGMRREGLLAQEEKDPDQEG